MSDDERTHAARAQAAIDAMTAECRRDAQLSAAHYLELTRSGVPTSDAVSLTIGFMNTIVQSRILHMRLNEGDKKPPWA